jgi:hypothetical protein
VFDSLDHKLSDAVPAPEADRGIPVGVDHRYGDLSTVPRIDRPWRVDESYAMPCREPGSRVHECGIAVGQSDGDSGRHNCTLTWGKINVGRRVQVNSGIARMRPRRQRQARV